MSAAPANLLGLANRKGAIAPGYDADFVIWSGSPLSSFSRVEQAWIDGRRHFDLGRDARLQEIEINPVFVMPGKGGVLAVDALATKGGPPALPGRQ